MSSSFTTALAVVAALGLALAGGPARGEPFLAVETGLQCAQCHTNPTGGGMRNAFGNAFAQSQLPAVPTTAAPWTGTVHDRFSIGADARTSLRRFDGIDNDALSFEIDRATLYLGAELGEHLSFYLDQRVAPGGTQNRELWMKFALGDYYLRAGRMFLPFGLRLEDDSAFIRQVTGINFTSPDIGVEIGTVQRPWSAQLALSNGTGGLSAADDGKQASLRAAHVQSRWQAGISANLNRAGAGERRMFGVFGGLRTGPVSWLAEVNRIDDRDFAPVDERHDVALLQGTIRFRQGHYLHLTAEMHSIDLPGSEDRFRYSAVFSLFPVAFSELRIGYRNWDSDDPAPALNQSLFFLQGHVFF